MRRAAVLLGILLLAVSWSASSPAEEPTKAPKALFIGIDGTRFDALRAARTPHLDALIEDGIHADNCLILSDRYRNSDTVSGPGWSSILTGVWADKHGVNDNSFRGRKYDAFPHFFVRLKSQQPEARTVSLVTWKPIHDYITSGADVSRALVDDTRQYDRWDERAAEDAVRELADPALTCMFLYFGQVDETGHRYGFHPRVPQYIAAIERVDGLLGKVLAAVRKREPYAKEDWLVVVTSDHGGKGTGHSRGHDTPEILHSFLIVSGQSAQRGTFAKQTYIVDAPVTVLSHLGVELKDDWKLDGRPVGLDAGRAVGR